MSQRVEIKGESGFLWTPNLPWEQSVRAALADITVAAGGGKILAPDLDVSPGYLSKMAGGSSPVGCHLLPEIVRRHVDRNGQPLLGRHLMDQLTVWTGAHQRALEKLPPSERERYDRLLISEIYPGRWVR